MSEEKVLVDEVLSDSELDEVAGGSVAPLNTDYAFFKKVCPELITTPFQSRYNSTFAYIIYLAREMPVVWENFGVKVCTINCMRSEPTYSINGKEVTADQARIHVLRQLKNRG